MNVFHFYSGDTPPPAKPPEIAKSQQLFFDIETGELSLGNGTHNVKITLKDTPEIVYLAIEDCDYQVCGAQINMAGAIIGDKSFTIYASIKTNTATIKWRAEK